MPNANRFTRNISRKTPLAGHNLSVGSFGEQTACDYLRRNGYRIIARNVKMSYREIDIIASEKRTLVFIEVKTRTSHLLGGAEYAIGVKKMKLFKKAVAQYLARENELGCTDFRVDFIAIDIDLSKKTKRLAHYRDVS